MNNITGNTGNNTLDGGAGADTLVGGLGNDTTIIDNTDTLTENANEGTDTVKAGYTYTLLTNFENLTLTGSSNINGIGNSVNNIIIGNSGNNTLTGNGGNDTLDGGAGADTLRGNAGNDIYIIDASDTALSESAGDGTDTVQANFSYTLLANFETLILTGSSNINATGNTGNNTLIGNIGENILSGGTGNDTMIGDLGHDTYIVDSVNDIVTEGVSAGIDLVQSGVTYTLGDNVENLTLTGTNAINATGNALDNVLIGNSNGNTFYGMGGSDTMIGGAGHDIYVVDSWDDLIMEGVSAGTDYVYSYIDYTLGNNIENLVMVLSDNLNGTGNSLVNSITGNSGNNILDGAGGADTLIGLSGDDTYIIDNTDILTEAASEGTDTVEAGFSYTLLANFENLTLSGSLNINGTGNGVDNILNGNSGNNTLSGGNGNDTLAGGDGLDVMTGGSDLIRLYFKPQMLSVILMLSRTSTRA